MQPMHFAPAKTARVLDAVTMKTSALYPVSVKGMPLRPGDVGTVQCGGLRRNAAQASDPRCSVGEKSAEWNGAARWE
ncbi:hypothetical protein E4U54_000190 [Claviceps lovelessii]|nr:hypothetical protein E4U54_000190 [Claviceps lovelessii]